MIDTVKLYPRTSEEQNHDFFLDALELLSWNLTVDSGRLDEAGPHCLRRWTKD
jgi:hypothetical protein